MEYRSEQKPKNVLEMEEFLIKCFTELNSKDYEKLLVVSFGCTRLTFVCLQNCIRQNSNNFCNYCKGDLWVTQ